MIVKGIHVGGFMNLFNHLMVENIRPRQYSVCTYGVQHSTYNFFTLIAYGVVNHVWFNDDSLLI